MSNETSAAPARPFIKTHKFATRVDAEIYAAEQRAKGHEAWITFTVRQRFVVTVRQWKAVR